MLFFKTRIFSENILVAKHILKILRFYKTIYLTKATSLLQLSAFNCSRNFTISHPKLSC